MRRFVVLFTILLAVSGVLLWDDNRTKTENSFHKENTRFLSIDIPSVARIDYARTEGAEKIFITIEKQDGYWQIIDPIYTLADQKEVINFLKALNNYHFVYRIKKPGDQLHSFGLLHPRSSFILTMKNRQAPILIKIGNTTPLGNLVYTQTNQGEEQDIYAGNSYVFNMTRKSLYDFRLKNLWLAAPEIVETIRYHSPPNKKILIQRRGSEYSILKPSLLEVDQKAVKAFLALLGRIHILKYVVKKSIHIPPILTIDIQVSKKQEFSWKMFSLPDGLYIQDSQQDEWKKIDQDWEEKLIKTLMDFRNRRIWSFDPEKVLEIIIRDKRYQKKDSAWFSLSAQEKNLWVQGFLLDFSKAKMLTFLDKSNAEALQVLSQEPFLTISLVFNDEQKNILAKIWEKSDVKGKVSHYYLFNEERGILYLISGSVIKILKNQFKKER